MNVSASSAPRLRDRPWLVACLVCVVLKLWFISAQPVIAIGGAGHDDRLFLNLANNLLCLQWLGPYTPLTLAKGPMYSLGIAGTFLLGIPLPLAQHLLYLAGCGLLVRALRPLLPSERAAALLFLLLWWNPMTYQSTVLGRILRQNFYTPETLLLFAALIALHTRREAPRKIRLAWGSLLGLAGVALYLTREESIWAAPSAALLIAVTAWTSWRAGDRLRSLAAPLVVAAGCAAAVLVTICSLNYAHYGWFGTVEFRAPEFIRAYGALQRVRPAVEIPRVPVSREGREMLYRVSPAFAELRPTFEGRVGLGWATASESVTHLDPKRREIAGGWFMWALRDAVHDAGHAHSAREALAFYARLADEVNAACDDGRLPAYPRRDTLLPRWTPADTTHLTQTLPAAWHYFTTFRDFTAWPVPSDGSPHLLKLFSDLTRWSLSPSPGAPELDHRRQRDIDVWRIAPLQVIGKAYTPLGWVLGYGGIAGAVVLAIRDLRHRRLSYALALAAAALGGAFSVVLINTLVDVLSFPNRSPGAFAEAYPLLLLFGGLVWIELASMLWPARPAAARGAEPR